MSQSAAESAKRPFYASLAAAYDDLIDGPVRPWVDAVCDELVRAGAPERAEVLDAGCGTGRHAAELIRRGHRVDLFDASAALLEQAAARCPGSRAVLGDLCALELPDRYEAVACRGVLNDLVGDDDRAAALAGMAGVLRPGGVLLLDVRDRDASAGRVDGRPRSRTVPFGAAQTLMFTDAVTWDDGLLRVAERYELHGGDERIWRHRFTMRPWSADELRGRLADAGLAAVVIGPGVGRSTGDRLFAVARKDQDAT